MFKKSKYYGEVWIPDYEDNKCFCLLEVKDGEVFLETNLYNRSIEYKIDTILGNFNDLGYLTFVNNTIQYSESGIIIARRYNPDYTFMSHKHFIDPQILKVKDFKINNKVINSWIRRMRWYNYDDQSLNKEDDIKHEIRITEKGLSIELSKTISFDTNNERLQLNNNGYVHFISSEKINFLDTIELYNQFKKFLLFFCGKSEQFTSFDFKCLGCGEWAAVHFKDSFESTSSHFIALEYWNVKDDLSTLLNKWYTNSDIQFCAEVIIDNLLASKVSYNRRFTNSITAFEAYSKRFGIKHKKATLERCLLDYRDVLEPTVSVHGASFENFVKKIVRSRDFYVHGNSNQTNIFSQFELLYISMLIDFTVGLSISKEMGLSDINANKILSQAQSTFLDMQSVNRMLQKNIFN